MKHPPLFYLILITLFGAIARIWYFWSDCLHVDEVFTYDLVQNNLTYIIQYSLTRDCNPPLFYIFDYFSLLIFGANNFAQRFPSVIAGILLIPTVYYFGKELKSETLGLLASLAVATLGPMWYYSQFGRGFMLGCLLFTVFCIYYIRLIRKDARSCNWIMVTIMAVLLGFNHLFALIPVTFLFLYLIWQYRIQSLKWVGLTIFFSSPLLLLFNEITRWRMVTRGTQTWGDKWYGATMNQLIIFSPLEYFGYSFVFWVPMIVYSTWINRKMREVLVLVGVSVASFMALVSVVDTTPVFLRYLLLLVPVLITIGLLPVADFIDNPDFNKAQKWFVIGSFGIFYFVIIFYAFWSGVYPAKGICF